MGNLSRQSLGEVWNSTLYKDYRDALAQGTPLKPCDNCYVLEYSKPFLYDCEPFGVHRAPEVVADQPLSHDLQNEGFLDVFKDLSDSDWKKAYLAKLDVDLEQMGFVLDELSQKGPARSAVVAQSFQDLVNENQRISQAFQDLVNENQRISRGFQDLVNENQRISQAFQDLVNENQRISRAYQDLMDENQKMAQENRELREAR
jgi:hypothetical protein